EKDDGATLVPNTAIAYGQSQAAGFIARRNTEAAAGGQDAQATPGARAQRAPGGGGRQANGAGAAPNPAGAPANPNADQPAQAPGAPLFVLRNGAPTLLRVQIGSTDGENTRVVSGLQPGDEVIVGGDSVFAPPQRSGGFLGLPFLSGGGGNTSQ